MCNLPSSPGERVFPYLIFIYRYTYSDVLYLLSHFTLLPVQALHVIINLEEILAFSSSTRCPLTRHITFPSVVSYIFLALCILVYKSRLVFPRRLLFHPDVETVREKMHIVPRYPGPLSRGALPP